MRIHCAAIRGRPRAVGSATWQLAACPQCFACPHPRLHRYAKDCRAGATLMRCGRGDSDACAVSPLRPAVPSAKVAGGDRLRPPRAGAHRAAKFARIHCVSDPGRLPARHSERRRPSANSPTPRLWCWLLACRRREAPQRPHASVGAPPGRPRLPRALVSRQSRAAPAWPAGAIGGINYPNGRSWRTGQFRRR